MIYAVGDIHGHLAELDRVLGLIEAEGGPDAAVVFTGDLVDRGPDSRGVLDRLMAGVAAGRDWTVLLGNHDRMFLRFLRHGRLTDAAIHSGATWLHKALGGAATLRSYGVDLPDDLPAFDHEIGDHRALPHVLEAARAAVPEPHLRFLEARPLTHRTEAQLFVHAGIRPGVPLGAQVEDDLVWIREPFLSDRRNHGALVVHGHTALPAARHFGNRLDLDSGAGYGNPLTAAAIDGRDAWLLSEAGRRPLPPQ
jgi:serine/threonine protein phosphatase 1